MPIIKSAIKRVRQTKKKTDRNTVVKKFAKEIIKRFVDFVQSGNLAEAKKLFPMVQKRIDMMAKNNLWHQNKAARKKSMLSKKLSGETTPVVAAAPKKKTAAKKPAAKKTSPKKSA